MKPKFVKVIATCFLVSIITYLSCSTKKLDIPPPTQSEGGFFTTEFEFRSAVVGAYSELSPYYSSGGPGYGGSAILQMWYQPGDDLTSDNEPAYEIFKGLTPGEGKVNQLFKVSYIMIARANKIIAKLAEKSDVFTTPGMKDNIEGEMLFLRSFSHFMLWNIYGTAPLDTIDINSTDQFNPGNSKGTELLDQCVKDLTRAASLLPATWSGADLGRVNKNAAYGFLGKVLTFRGTVNKSAADFTAAIAAFDAVTGRSLVADMNDNYSPDKENNSESIFEYQAGGNIAGGNNSWLGNDDCDCGATGAFYANYIPGGGTDHAGGLHLPTAKLKASYEAGDPRIDVTLSADKSRIVKYTKNSGGPVDVGAGLLSTNNRILRFADIMLLKAEAVLQSNGSLSQAIGLINDVRTRARNMVAGGTVPANFSTAETNKTTIMQWIMDERLRELAGEGQRWFDLRRWQLAGIIDLNNAFFSSNKVSIGYDDKNDDHYLYFPIPESETNKNPNIAQNPGY